MKEFSLNSTSERLLFTLDTNCRQGKLHIFSSLVHEAKQIHFIVIIFLPTTRQLLTFYGLFNFDHETCIMLNEHFTNSPPAGWININNFAPTGACMSSSPAGVKLVK